MNNSYMLGAFIGYCYGTVMTFLLIWFGSLLNIEREKEV